MTVKHLFSVLHNIQTDANDLHDMQMLSDGSLLMAVWWTTIKEDLYGHKEVVRDKTGLVQYSLQTGEVLFCKEFAAAICNIAEIDFAGIPSFAVGYK